MTESTDRGAEPGPPETVTATVAANDVTVEKVAASQPDGSVAVKLSIRSGRADPSDVRVIDRLPDSLPDGAVEFHPDADPNRVSRANGAVVFEATATPEDAQMTAYRVRIDRPLPLEPFAGDPSLEVGDYDVIFDYWADDGSVSKEESETATDVEAGSDVREPTAEPAADDADPHPPDGPAAEPVPVGRSASRNGADTDGSDLDRRIRSLRADVAALRESVEGDGQDAADLERIEAQVAALSDTVDDRFQSLAADLDALRSEVERGARWRSLVQESFEYDPAEE